MRRLFSISSVAVAILTAHLSATAQEAQTVPVGMVTITADAAVNGTPKITSISLPLVNPAVITGEVSGRITGVTTNSISNSNAGWTAGELSQTASPFVIRITSGAALGRTFLISNSSQNTSSTIFLDAEDANLVDLNSLGILTGTNGDTYEILQCDTIAEVFGTPATTGVVGGVAPGDSDIVSLLTGGTWKDYYYNTTLGAWVQAGTNTPSDHVPIRPDTAVNYKRVAATPLQIALTGRVPHLQRQAIVANSGDTYLSNGWPVNTTLGTAGIHLIPGWVSSPNPNTADTVAIFVSGAWRTYYHNGTQWLRAGPNTPSNGVAIPFQSGVIIKKRGSAAGSSALTQSVPYTL